MIQQEYFGAVRDQAVMLYALSAGGIVVKVMDYGATIVAIEVPDKNSQTQNIVAGLSSLAEYLKPHPYLGVIVGRYANRIAFGKFLMDGKTYQLPINDPPNHLHGGDGGFHTKVWQTKWTRTADDECALSLAYLSPDMEEGYPGNLDVSVIYKVNFNELQIHYQVSTDKPTPVNLTSHPYFNLSGFTEPTIRNHELQINGEHFAEKNNNNIPTGRLLHCDRTPHDFRRSKKIGTHLEELTDDKGYDHNYVIDNYGAGVRLVAILTHRPSGRTLEVLSDRPGLQVYTANFWDSSITGSQGMSYGQHAAVALETQHYPDSPNHDNFPATIVKPGEHWRSQTIYRFLTD
ncbi:MAG: aldose epimerase family protein [Chryseolinea sp.]